MRDSEFFEVRRLRDAQLLILRSPDGTNRLTRECVMDLHEAVISMTPSRLPLIITGNKSHFSVGADLREIASIDAVAAREFSRLGQALMNAVADFPAPVFAAISGFCLGGGFDLAMACHRRIVSPNAVIGHRGAALGLLTGWGGTQRLPRWLGRARALQLLAKADRVSASDALQMGLVEAIAEDPIEAALERIASSPTT